MVLCVAPWVLKFIAIKRYDSRMHLAEEYLGEDLLSDKFAVKNKFNNITNHEE